MAFGRAELAREIAYSMDPEDPKIYEKFGGVSYLSTAGCLNKIHEHGYRWDGKDWCYYPELGESDGGAGPED